MNKTTELAYIEAMLVRTMNNRELAIVLFKKLFLELPKQLVAIESAIEKQQFVAAQKRVHKLHGSLSFCGFYELETLAGDLETALLENNLQQIAKYLPSLVQKINAFVVLQEEILMQLGK